MKLQEDASAAAPEVDTLDRDAAYPKLAKRASDGRYCYVVQRRFSLHITKYCVRHGISANVATGIDMLLAVAAAVVLSQGFYVAGLILIQLFGLWSCVDGEIARLSGSSSKLGDFLDTMTDRSAEFLIFAGVLFSVSQVASTISWALLFFLYIGMVFLITASSEKFRSVYQRNYPKSEHEKLFSWLCAGSDTRFFYLSLALLVCALTGYVAIIEWLMIVLTGLLALNFVFRIWKVSTLTLEDSSALV